MDLATERRQRAQRRRLGSAYRGEGAGLHLPEGTSPAWVYKTDWRALFDEMHRVADILEKRFEHTHSHVRRLGTLPHGELAHEHKTGYSMLDWNVPPSKAGTRLRRLAAWVKGESFDDATHERTRKAPRATDSVAMEAATNALVGDESLMTALQTHVEHTNRHDTSHVRRLADAWLGAATSVPLNAGGILSKYGSYPPSGSTDCGRLRRGWRCARAGPSALKETARILIFDTLLCYLYPINDEPVSDYGDGTKIKKHRSNRMCFPAIPFAPEQMQSFQEVLGIEDPNWTWDQLEFSQCDSDAVRSAISLLGQPNEFTAGPIGLVVRVAEAVDSLHNFIRLGSDDLNGVGKAHVLVCALAQLGGVLWSAALLVVIALACCCAPIGGACALLCWRSATRQREMRRRRGEALDRMYRQVMETGASRET
mgnify:CR=1 FL=1